MTLASFGPSRARALRSLGQFPQMKKAAHIELFGMCTCSSTAGGGGGCSVDDDDMVCACKLVQ